MIEKLKFVNFLPNVKEAENPFPGASPLLFVYDINIWLPVDNVAELRVFPVKAFKRGSLIVVFPVKIFNRESLSLPPSYIFKKLFSIYIVTNNVEIYINLFELYICLLLYLKIIKLYRNSTAH